MTWTAFRTRGEVLRAVADEADLRRDGSLPWHLPDVSTTFRDELDLVASLQLRWYTRLTGQIERHLAADPMDLEAAVRRAWIATAEELPGIRAILDREAAHPTTPEIAAALGKATVNEHSMLALMAGKAGTSDRRDPRAVEAGRRIELAAREDFQPGVALADPAWTVVVRADASAPSPAEELREVEDVETTRGDVAEASEPVEAAGERVPSGSASFVARLKAALAA